MVNIDIIDFRQQALQRKPSSVSKLNKFSPDEKLSETLESSDNEDLPEELSETLELSNDDMHTDESSDEVLENYLIPTWLIQFP